jgi:hypothetical protein
MHTQEKDDKVQFVTLTWATTKAEKQNKHARDGATERIWRGISYPKLRGLGLGRMLTRHCTQMHRFEGLAPSVMRIM